MKNILVAQSGGPTAVINATLAGVIMESMISEEIDKVYGGVNGIQGVLEEKFVELNQAIKNTSDIELLAQTPAAALGSCRFKLQSFENGEEQYEKIVQIFRKYDIAWFIYIGGNDSMDTVDKLSAFCKKKSISDIQIVGVPKTVDNDLMEIDHCPGFPSAARYIATTFAELERDTAVYEKFGVTIVEVMGRNAGWLTASAALARINGAKGPDFIYLCEKPFHVESFVEDIKSKQSENRNVLIAVSEGVKDETGKFITEQKTSNEADVFGHKDIAGTGKILEEIVRERIGCKVRSIELSLMQRCASHLASKVDCDEAKMLGAKAVKVGLAGQTGKMVTLNRTDDQTYKIKFSTVDVSKVANEEKTVPLEWINASGNDVTDEMMQYLLPLIQENTGIRYKNGLPEHIALYDNHKRG
ncbi:6-phosphofructokinase [Lachnospiraceae bacterium ZAX-1]